MLFNNKRNIACKYFRFFILISRFKIRYSVRQQAMFFHDNVTVNPQNSVLCGFLTRNDIISIFVKFIVSTISCIFVTLTLPGSFFSSTFFQKIYSIPDIQYLYKILRDNGITLMLLPFNYRFYHFLRE